MQNIILLVFSLSLMSGQCVGSRSEGAWPLHQGSLNMASGGLCFGLTLDPNAPPYMRDWVSPRSCNKDPRTLAVT